MQYVDALFAMHPNMRGHTGGGLTLGRGFPISVSPKQKLNTRSLTESELVDVNDMMPIICWTHYFLLSQGYGIIENLLLQDNQSSILLERNGKATSGKHTRHICWRSSISVLILILMLVSTGRGRQIHLASKIPFYLLQFYLFVIRETMV